MADDPDFVMTDRAWMTPLLNRIADIAGVEAAVALGREKACQKIYIPETIEPGHWLPRLIGLEPAQKLAKAFGSQKIEIPPAIGGDRRRRAARIAEMIDQGYSNNVIASTLGVAITTVKEHRRRAGDDRQLKLF